MKRKRESKVYSLRKHAKKRAAQRYGLRKSIITFLPRALDTKPGGTS